MTKELISGREAEQSNDHTSLWHNQYHYRCRWSMGARASLSERQHVKDALITGKVYARANCLVSGRSIVYVCGLLRRSRPIVHSRHVEQPPRYRLKGAADCS